jgi:hypothetical protein
MPSPQAQEAEQARAVPASTTGQKASSLFAVDSVACRPRNLTCGFGEGPHVSLPGAFGQPLPELGASAGHLAIIAVVSVLSVAVWLILVFAADREPRHRRAAGTTSLPQQPRAQEQEREQPERKVA